MNTNANVLRGSFNERLAQTCLPILIVAALLISAASGFAQRWENNPPIEPYRVIGNIYYVGMSDVTAFLITTPQGHFLLDSSFPERVSALRENIEKLGFQVKDVKYLLSSHGHHDHLGGHRMMKEWTGAQILIAPGDGKLLEDGGRSDFRGDGSERFPPVKPDQLLRDGEQVSLGGITMTAHFTPGHTPGCTTWTTTVSDGGRTYNVVFVGGMRLGGEDWLVNNPKYPQMVEDFAAGFRTLKSLQPDVFLASHGNFYGMADKLERMKQGAAQNPFIDPAGFKAYVAQQERIYLDHLEKERREPRVRYE